MECVYCAVRTGSLNVIHVNFRLLGVNIGEALVSGFRSCYFNMLLVAARALQYIVINIRF